MPESIIVLTVAVHFIRYPQMATAATAATAALQRRCATAYVVMQWTCKTDNRGGKAKLLRVGASDNPVCALASIDERLAHRKHAAC